MTVPFGAPAALSGRLLDADGAGLASRWIRVVARPSRGAVAPVRSRDRADRRARRLRLDLPAGPSRRITVAFRGDDRLDRGPAGAALARVRSSVLFHAAPGSLSTGQAIALLGQGPRRGGAVTPPGKLVAIQYLEAATDRWRPVLVTRTDHSGRFRARYRFRYISGAARIRLRAVALSEERWPYVPGASRPLGVRVSG